MRRLTVAACLLLPAAPGLAAAAATPVASPAGATVRAPALTRAAPPDTTRPVRFDVPAGPLADALVVFRRQSGLHVEIAPDAAGAEARPLTALLTAPDALRALLAGSGLTARFRDAESVVVERAPRDQGPQALAPVRVTAATGRAAYAALRTTTVTRTDAALRDVPQSVTTVGRSLIADQSMQSMADVVRYIPGITMGQGEGHRDAPTIRGNSTTADFYADGVRDDVQYLRDLYNVERVEALKGANAIAFGRGSGAGAINRVLKQAGWSPVRALTLEGGSFTHRRATLDLGDGFGRHLAARVNGLFEDSRQFRDATRLERHGINPTATVLAGRTLLQLGYEYFADRRTVNRGIPSFQGGPSPADVATFFGDPDESRSRATVHAAGVAVERELAGGLTLRNRTRLAHYDKFYQNVYPSGAVSAAGTEVKLSAYDNATTRRNLFTQTDLAWTHDAGSVRQTLLVGAELGRQATDNARRTGYFGGSATSLTVPFDRPTVSTDVEFRPSATDADNHVDADVAAVYLQEQLALGSRATLTAGLRYERFALRFRDNRTATRLRRDDTMLSPRVGVVLTPVAPLSVYGSWSVSHLPGSGDQFASLTATTRTLEPERFTTREIGVKWDVRPELAVTAALYQLDRTNTAAPDPADPARTVQTGRQRTTGHELAVTGQVTPAWQIVAGYAAQHARIVSRTAAAAPGAIVPLVPRQTLAVWNRYQIVPRLGAGVGLVHQTRMYAAIDNAVTLPGFVRVDAAAYLTLSSRLRAQLNVENLLDERYYPTSHGNNNIMPGAPRSVRLSLTVAP